MLILNTTDFEGFYNLSQNCYDTKDLELFIQDFEPEYRCKVLGNTLNQELDLALEQNAGVLPQGHPLEYLFLDSCLGCGSCCGCGCSKEESYYIGLKKVLLGFIFYEYVIQQPHNNTITGYVNGQNATSSKVSNLTNVRLAEQRYNRSVVSANLLQSKLLTNYKGYCPFKVKYYPLL